MVFNNINDRLVSHSAIVIALASIFLSVWQGNETRKHNRLSVRPKLEITFTVSEDHFGYVLVNNGLGPAVLKEKVIYLDGEIYDESGFSGYENLLSKLGMEERDISFSGLGSGGTMREGARKDIIVFSYDRENESPETYMNVHNRLAFELIYESMYGESFTCRFPRK